MALRLAGKVYREFSRQKYAKYRAQYPKLREGEVVTKIIKEWDALDINEKRYLLKVYLEKKFISEEESDSEENLRKIHQQNQKARKNAEQSARKEAQEKKACTKYWKSGKMSQKRFPIEELDSGEDFNRHSEARYSEKQEQSENFKPLKKKKRICKFKWQQKKKLWIHPKAALWNNIKRYNQYTHYNNPRWYKMPGNEKHSQTKAFVESRITYKLQKKKKTGKRGIIQLKKALVSLLARYKKKIAEQTAHKHSNAYLEAYKELFGDKQHKYFPLKKAPLNTVCYTCQGRLSNDAVKCNYCQTLFHKSQESIGRPSNQKLIEPNKPLFPCKPPIHKCPVCQEKVLQKLMESR